MRRPSAEFGDHPGRIETEKASFVFFEQQSLPQELVDRTIQQINEVIANPDRYIDKGGAGKVYRMGDGWCIKVLEPRHSSPNAHLMNLGNTVELEAAFQRRLGEENVEGVRVPWCFGYATSKEKPGFTAIFMEELDAVNAQHVLNGTQSLPEGFDTDRFTEALYAFVEHMHELHIAHADLEARNVMIDRTTGLPRVIDFGRAINLKKTKGPVERHEVEQEDLDNIDKIDRQLQTLQGLTPAK